MYITREKRCFRGGERQLVLVGKLCCSVGGGEGEGAAAAFVRAPNDMPATVEPNSLARPQLSHSAAPCTPLF